MKTFTEGMRFEYPFTADSVVIDAGAYEGNFSLEMSRKYACRILAFEPIALMAHVAAAQLIAYPKVNVYTLGIGGNTRNATFHIKGSMTGIASEGCTSEEVKIRDIVEVLEEFGLNQVSLLKMNCEGCEFEILERILSAGLASRFLNIAIQWHAVVPGFRARRESITNRLSATHELTWQDPDFGTGHENWHLKS